MHNKTLFVAVVFLLISAELVLAQTPPTHTRVLYQDNLQSAGEKTWGTITPTQGSFTATGWQSNSHNSQLRLDFKDYLPHEGTLQIKVSNLNPASQVTSDWTIMSIWSRPEATYGALNPTPGSYVMLKSEAKADYISGGVAWKLVYTPFYGGETGTAHSMKVKNTTKQTSWNSGVEHIMQIVWNPKNMWIVIDGQVVSTNAFKDQIENFEHVFLGKDNLYGSMIGPVYTEMQILVPDNTFRFRNAGKSAGLDADMVYGAQGISITDVNQDNLNDVYINYCNPADGIPNALYMNDVSNQFTDQALTAGLDNTVCTNASLFADFDGDGDQDVFLCQNDNPNKLYINNGNGIFSDQTASRGIVAEANRTLNAIALDIENDGDLDIFAVNSGQSHELYVNQGNGTFVKETRGVTSPNELTFGAVAGDVNNDGYVDIFVSRQRQNGQTTPCVLYINNGAGSFSNQAQSRGVAANLEANNPTMFDYDNDGDLDIFVAISGADETIVVFNNDGTGNFTNSSSAVNISIDAFGFVPGDFDNDGFQDLYAVKSNIRSLNDLSSRVFRNNGNGTFTQLTGTGAEANYADGRAGMVFDYNNDGLLDIYGVAKGNRHNGVRYTSLNFGRNYLFRNTIETANNYIKVAVNDAFGNPDGVGAKIWVYEAGRDFNQAYLLGYRDVYSMQGYASQAPLVQHFGVGNNTQVDVKIQTPGSNPSFYTNITVNQLLEVNPLQVVPDYINVSGHEQAGKAGQTLANPIQVHVYTDEAEPAPGVSVQFEVTAGSGTLNGDSETSVSVNTDDNGLAQVNWKMGTIAGQQNTLHIVAQYNAAHLDGSPFDVNITPGAGDPAILVKSSGDAQSGYILQFLENPVAALVTDDFDNPVEGHPVVFSIAGGNGSVNEDGTTTVSVNTGSDGIAQADWLLGDTIGSQTLNALSTYDSNPLQNSPLQFTATGQPPQHQLLYESGNYQTMGIGSQLNPFSVKVVDFTDTPKVGENIEFRVISGPGNFGGETSVTIQTNAQGIATATATLGTVAGDTNYVFHAISPGASGSPVIFKASATPGSASKLVQVAASNNQTAMVARTLPVPLQVKVTDTHNNPVAGGQVTFTVSKGGGTIDGATYTIETSGADGIAQAFLKLGQNMGENIVVASSEGLEGSPVTFFAQGTASTPNRIDIFSGNNQSGNMGQPLAQDLTVIVRDSFFNPIVDHNVQFNVTEGDGNIEGLTSINKLTDANGKAAVTMTMGTQAFTNVVQASATHNSAPLANSPVTFIASTGPGNPAILTYVDGNEQTGKVNAELNKAFQVRVTDDNGIPVKGHEVQFISYTSGAHFSGSTIITKRTDSDGYAKATATLGTNFVTYEFEAVARFNNVSLTNSPMRFEAYGRESTATQMTNMTTGALSGTAGVRMPDSLQVRVMDDEGNRIEGHPVDFQVTSGQGSLLNGSHSNMTVYSDAFGIARVSVTLRQTPGTATVVATSDNGLPGGDLEGSPINYSILAVTGAPDAEKSMISSNDNILADGQTQSTVNITLRDAFNNPVAGKVVTLESAGIEVIKTQPVTTTNSQGATSGAIASNMVGQVYVWAVVDGQIVKRDTINFIAGAPAAASSNTLNSGQNAIIGQLLPENVGVVVRDAYNHPIPGVSVTFEVLDDAGSIEETQPVLTNSEGQAMVHWRLGSAIGIQYLNASIAGIDEQFVITAIATAPTLANITKVSGDSTLGLTDHSYTFTVAVIDTNDNPIVNYEVDFDLILGTGEGQGAFTTSATPQTDNNGRAFVTFRSGTMTGLHKIKATAGDYGYVTFNFIIEDQRSVDLEKLAGDGQTVRPNTKINLSLLVRNAFDKPVNDENIMFSVVEGLGILDTPQPVTSNASGVASTGWTVSTQPGTHKVKAKPVDAVGDSVFFTAIVVNSAPVMSDELPGTVNITWGQTYHLTITATDADGDNISYGVRGKPINATFDSTGTHQFSWYPDVSQSGEHEVTFIATDAYGASDSTKIVFNVIVENRCPVITDWAPADTNTFDVDAANNTVVFMVSATDPDGDELLYEWRVNDVYNGSDTTLTIPFSPDFFTNTNNTVQVIVSDGTCDQSITWGIRITRVELSAFSATSLETGIELLWETATENNNAGFNILRSHMESGAYAKINEVLLPASNDGHYSFTDANAKAGVTYYYKLQDVDVNGVANEHGPVTAQIALPSAFALSQNYPNPFNPTTTIRYELPEPAQVTINIYNTNGQLVRTLVNTLAAPGYHLSVWDAKNNQGLSIPSGIYFYRMQAGDFNKTKKLLLLK